MAQIASTTSILFRIDLGFNPEKGYAAVIYDVALDRQKGIKAGSIRQLMRIVSQEVCDCEQKSRRFPLEKEEPSRIITPNGFQ